MADPEKKSKEANKGPEIRDVSELVDHSTIQLQDLDHRLQVMRQQLSGLSQMAIDLQQQGVGSQIPPQTQTMQSGHTTNDPPRATQQVPAQQPTPQPSWPAAQQPIQQPAWPAAQQPNQQPSWPAAQQPIQQPSWPAAQQPTPQSSWSPAMDAWGIQQWSSPWAAPSPSVSAGGARFGYEAEGAPIRQETAPGEVSGVRPGLSFDPSRSASGFSDTTRSTRDLRNSPPVQRSPTVDIIDEGSGFQVQLELPGVKKDDLEIMVTDQAIVVEASASPELEEGVVMVNERGPVAYRRAIHLPALIDTKDCKAKLKDGVLTLDVPKKEPTEGARRVAIAYG